MVTLQQTLSLAAVVQCCILVQRMARTGNVDENNLSRMVRTAMVVDIPDPESLYDGITDISKALSMVGELATGKPDADDLDILRMSHCALQLQATLRGNDMIRDKLGRKLANLTVASRPVPYTDEVYFSLNDIYTETLTHLRPSIIVNGAEGHLQSAVLVAKVRSVLLAAVRNAYLWHQLGGRRWHLLIFRKRYGEAARELLRGAT